MVAQAVILLVGFVAHTLVSPVALIGLTLVYFDQRVRMEGFDLVMLLGGAESGADGGVGAAPVRLRRRRRGRRMIVAAEIGAAGPDGAGLESDGHV